MINAKYTEVLYNLLQDDRCKNLIENAMSKYPLYKQKTQNSNIPIYIPKREELNKKILDYYKYREIAFETVGRFIDELEIALKEIMPFYNQVFYSIDQDYNILYNADYTKNIERTRNDNDNNEITSNSSDNTTNNNDNYSKNVNSDTPQNSLNISANNIDSIEHASNVDWNKQINNNTINSNNETNSSSNGSHSENEGITEHLQGNYGMTTTQSLIKQYRELILNVEQEIIHDDRIKELFMLIY